MIKHQQPSVSLLKQALVIAERIQELEGELAAILAQNTKIEPAANAAGAVTLAKRGPGKTRKKPKFSAAARESIAAAQRARWAKIKKEKGEKVTVVAKKTKKRKKPKFSAEARERIASAQRARWAKIRKGK